MRSPSSLFLKTLNLRSEFFETGDRRRLNAGVGSFYVRERICAVHHSTTPDRRLSRRFHCLSRVIGNRKQREAVVFRRNRSDPATEMLISIPSFRRVKDSHTRVLWWMKQSLSGWHVYILNDGLGLWLIRDLLMKILGCFFIFVCNILIISDVINLKECSFVNPVMIIRVRISHGRILWR